MGRIFYSLILVVISQTILPAQVKLLLDYNASTRNYSVSMMPERTWRSPYNKTATGQITLKATTGQFFIDEVESHIPEADWIPSGRVNAPLESPGYDYIFFRLKTPGLTELPYKAFRPVKLFSFKLEANCAREVMLVSNYEAEFLPPNSKRVNIGNSLGVLGASGEAYAGNISDLPIFCRYAAPPTINDAPDATPAGGGKIASATDVTALLPQKSVYPNPTSSQLNIDLTYGGPAGEKQVFVYNGLGELVRFYNADLVGGFNRLTYNINDLAAGIYSLQLVDAQRQLDLGKLIKVD